MSKVQLLSSAALIVLSVCGSAARAQEAAPAAPPPAPATSGALQEIVVTAQRRSEGVNSVPMSITATSAAQLTQRGVTNIGDIAKVTPGLTYSQTAYATPVFTLRGIGFNENTLAAAPNVAVYVDEVPLPYPSMTSGALLDPQRVEVLKGPQGLLYGQNSTGGAINFIAAKPGKDFETGITTSIERFGLFQANGFVSTPLTSTLGVRVAGSVASGGAWQKSFTRDATLGKQDVWQGRALFDWKPTSDLSITLNINGWTDRSDTQAGQIFAIRASVPARADPTMLAYPLAPQNARAADWTPGKNFDRDNRFFQSALRADYKISPNITLTSISAYSHYHHDIATDTDGTALRDFDAGITGRIRSLYQEVRLIGDGPKLSWIIGGNYADDNVREDQLYDFAVGSSHFIGGVSGIQFLANYSHQKIKTGAGFGQLTYKLTPQLKFEAGVRYTKTHRDFDGCTGDPGDGTVSAGGEALERVFAPGRPVIPIAPGGCVTLNRAIEPGVITDTLKEDNVSWRGGVTWTPASGSLFYANVSRGYKAGSFPTLNAFFAAQYEPAKQEKLTAYEAGIKQSLFNRTMQLNAAAFYYDYRDKQIRGRQLDPVSGTLVKLLNIPKSRAIGGEASLTWRPIPGLTISGQATYIDTKIKNYTFYNNFGRLEDFSGEPYPFTSKFSGNADIEYKMPVSERYSAFVGGTVTGQSSQRSALGSDYYWNIPAYTLADFRIGAETEDGRIRATAFVRNAFNKYYWTNALYSLDSFFRLAGRPRTYGLTLSFRTGR